VNTKDKRQRLSQTLFCIYGRCGMQILRTLSIAAALLAGSLLVSAEESVNSLRQKSDALIAVISNGSDFDTKAVALLSASSIPKDRLHPMLKSLIEYREERLKWFGEHRSLSFKRTRSMDDYLLSFSAVERLSSGLLGWTVVWYKGDSGWTIVGLGCTDNVTELLKSDAAQTVAEPPSPRVVPKPAE